MSITIYFPEGQAAYTSNVAGHEVESNIAGNTWWAEEARALKEFSAATEIPSSLLRGKLALAEEGVENGIPFARYVDREPVYYAICNVNGPVSVKLDASSEEDAVAEFQAADARAWIDDGRTDAEDDLGIDGSSMDDASFDEALKAAGARPVRDLDEIVNGHTMRVAHLSNGWTLWVI
jgi:hypothetical protein